MKWSVSRGIALTITALVTLGGGWLLLAPTTVGGPVSLVVTSGISMQPRFHTGDLAVLRTSGSYHVGDIVGYHSPTLGGAVVMHRLVAADGDRFTTKGDHNSWLDPEHPTSADIVGKLWVHVPKGGFVLTRMLLPLALLSLVGLLLPARKRRNADDDDDSEIALTRAPSRAVAAAGTASRGRHASRTRAPELSGRLPAWLSREACSRAVAGGLALAIVGAAVAIVGYARPLHRMADVAQPSSTTVRFGWSGVSDHTMIYPDGRVTDPAPIFSKLVHQLTLTADVTVRGRPLGAPTLIATLSDSSGWTHQWQFDGTAEHVGQSLRLSGTVSLDMLLLQVAWVQATTGVSGPATFTLRVAQDARAADSGPALSFALSNVTFTPQGPLAVTTSSTTVARRSVPGTITVSRHSVLIGHVRQTGAIAVALGLLVALAAGLLSRLTPRPTAADRLQRLFAGRVVHLAGAEEWERACLAVRDADSLAAFAATPTAVLYVIDGGKIPTLIAERGAVRLRYAPGRDAEAMAESLTESLTAEPDQAVTQDECTVSAALPTSPAIPKPRPWAAGDGADVETETAEA